MSRSILLLAFAVSAPLWGTTITWTGSNGFWSSANFWSCPACSGPTYPNNGNLGNVYDVLINGPSVVTLDVSSTINTLNIASSASLNGSNGVSLSVTGSSSNSGAIQLHSGSTLTSASLTNSGSLFLVDPNTSAHISGGLTSNSGTVSVYNGANLSSGAFLQNSTATVIDGVGSSIGWSSFTQDAASTFHSTNQAVTTVSGPFANNGGGVNVQSGSKLNISGAFTNSGSLYLVDPNSLVTAASLANTSGSVGIYNSARLQVAGAYTQTNSSTQIDGVGTSLQAGSFSQDANSSFHSTNTANTTITSGFMNSGSINLQSGSKLIIDGALTNLPGSSVFLTDPNTTLQAASVSNTHASVSLNYQSTLKTGDYSETASATSLDGIGTSLQASSLEVDPSSSVTLTNQSHVTVSGTLTNNGAIKIESGSGVQAGQITDTGTISLIDANSSVTAQTITLDGGTLSGYGTVAAYLVNNGTDSPGDPGVQTITGGYTQGASGLLTIGLASLMSYDQLDVTGNVNLGGELEVNLLNGYLPSLSDLFTIISVTGGTISGNFSAYAFPTFDGLTFKEFLHSNSVELEVVSASSGDPAAATPEPATFGLTLLVLLAGCACRVAVKSRP